MRTAILALAGALLSAACDQALSERTEVAVEGQRYAVYPMRNRPGAWYAEPADRSAFFSPFPGLRAGNVRAIEAVSGCEVIPETVRHVDHISTDAEVDCA